MICLKCGTTLSDDADFCSECGAKQRNKLCDKIYRPTIHGGVMSEAKYFDLNHNPCTKDKAAFMEVSEYDGNGERIYQFTAKRKNVQ